MEMNRASTIRKRGLIVMAVMLSVIASSQAVLLWVAMDAVGSAKAELKGPLTKLSVMILATMGLTLVFLLWVLIRIIKLRLAASEQRSHTEYVDAWSLAGKRLKLEDQIDVIDDEPEDEDEEGDDDSGRSKPSPP